MPRWPGERSFWSRRKQVSLACYFYKIFLLGNICQLGYSFKRKGPHLNAAKLASGQEGVRACCLPLRKTGLVFSPLNRFFCIKITSGEWFLTALNSLEDKELVKAKTESGITMPILVEYQSFWPGAVYFTSTDTSIGELQHENEFQWTVKQWLNCSSVLQRINKLQFLDPNCILKWLHCSTMLVLIFQGHESNVYWNK